MSALEELLARNERHAERAEGELPALPRRRLVVLTCVDHRVDPAHVFGLELGDAVVVRNPGGRVTPSFLRDLAILARVFPEIAEEGERFELALIQHTECGFGRLDEEANGDLLADYFGVPVGEMPGRHLSDDPHAGVRADLDLIAADHSVPASLAVSGLVYEIATGRAELVERRDPLRAAE
jgi:carbonic anhydrase